MAIRGLPRPLPECKECGDPVRRQTWTETGGYCRKPDCLTPARAMAAAHRREHLARLARETTSSVNRRVDARIADLAAKRQEREARLAGLIP